MRKKRTRIRLLFVVSVLFFGLPQRTGWETGACLLAAGGLLHAVAAGYLTKNRVLAVGGPYRFVRNPFYVADFLRDLGLLLACHFRFSPQALPVWWMGLVYFAVMFGIVIRGRVLKKEEPELRRHFGAAYTARFRRVPRFVPKLRPEPADPEAGFAFATLHHNREIPRLAFTLGLIVITYYRWEAFYHEFRLPKVLDDHGEIGLIVLLPVLLLLAKLRPEAARLGAGRRPASRSDRFPPTAHEDLASAHSKNGRALREVR